MSDARVNDYDRFAAGYTAHNDSSPWNALYERPAALGMMGDADGLRVLDAGCGAGAHARELQAGGATVTGFDMSAGLLEIARERLGPGVALHQGDLAEPLPFADGSFDVVLASLVLHYLEHWEPTLRELHRVLMPRGRLIASTHHPFMDHAISDNDDYFATYLITEEWNHGDEPVTMSFWHRPLRAMFGAFNTAGFRLIKVNEPEPDPSAEALFPDAYRSLSTKPRFLFFEAQRP